MARNGESLDGTLLTHETVPEEEEEQVCCCSKSLRELVKLSIAYFFVFTGYSGVQNLASSLDLGSVSGSVSIGIIYILFTVTSLIAPIIIKLFGTKTTMVLQFSIITLFVASNIYPKFYTTYPAAGLLGFGAAPSWVSQGEYVSTLAEKYNQINSEDVFGMFNGIFYGFFQATQVSGNLISFFVLDKDKTSPTEAPTSLPPLGGPPKTDINDSTKYLLYMSFMISCLIGIVIMQLTLEPLKPKKKKAEIGYTQIEEGYVHEVDEESSCHVLTSTLRLMVRPHLFLLIPIMVANGLEMGFAYSTLTANVIKVNLGEAKIGLGMICFGAFDTFSSLFFGKISDQKRVGISSLLFIASALQIACGAWLWFYFDDLKKNSWKEVYIICGVWGIGDGISNTLLSARLGAWFPREKDAAFSNWKMFQSLGTSVFFFMHDYISFESMLLMVGIGWVVGIIGLFFAGCMFSRSQQ